MINILLVSIWDKNLIHGNAKENYFVVIGGKILAINISRTFNCDKRNFATYSACLYLGS